MRFFSGLDCSPPRGACGASILPTRGDVVHILGVRMTFLGTRGAFFSGLDCSQPRGAARRAFCRRGVTWYAFWGDVSRFWYTRGVF